MHEKREKVIEFTYAIPLYESYNTISPVVDVCGFTVTGLVAPRIHLERQRFHHLIHSHIEYTSKQDRHSCTRPFWGLPRQATDSTSSMKTHQLRPCLLLAALVALSTTTGISAFVLPCSSKSGSSRAGRSRLGKSKGGSYANNTSSFLPLPCHVPSPTLPICLFPKQASAWLLHRTTTIAAVFL